MFQLKNDGPLEIPEVKKKEIAPTFGNMLTKSLLLIVAIGMVAFGVSYFFGAVAFETHDPGDLFQKIVNGRSEVRRMAAAEWSRTLAQVEEEPEKLRQWRPNPTQSKILVSEMQAQLPKDPQLAAGLAFVLGFSEDPAVVRPALVDFARSLQKEASYPETQVYVLLALGRLGEAPLDIFTQAAQSSDPALRTAAAFSLGLSQDFSLARAPLMSLLKDEHAPVRWNAAFALARKKESAAGETLRELLSEVESKNAGAEQVMADKFQVYQGTFRAVRELADPELLRSLESIAHKHSNLKIRQAAKVEIQKHAELQKKNGRD